MAFYQYAYYFLIYAFAGWCCEVAYAAIIHGKFVNRGFLAGPVCPIYGAGACIVIMILSPIKSNFLLTYICAALLTSVLEYITGYLLEVFFHQKWWDYSNRPLNLRGYICLEFSLLWGIGCCFVVYILHRFVYAAVDFISFKLGIVILAVLGGVFVLDSVYTVAQMLKLRKVIDSLHEFETFVRKTSDNIGEDVADMVFSAMEKKQKAENVYAEIKAKYPSKLKNEFKLEDFRSKYKSLIENRRRARIGKRLSYSFPNMRNNRLLKKYILRMERIKNKYDKD